MYEGVKRIINHIKPLRFQLQVQHFKPGWARVLPCTHDAILI